MGEAISESEFYALTDRIVAALGAAPGLPPYSVEYAAPEWKPGRIGVLLRFRSEVASHAAFEAIERAGLPSEPTTDGWRERIVLGEAAAKARGWVMGTGGGAGTQVWQAEAMASAASERKGGA